MIFYYVNFSEVFGGQERYLKDSMNFLAKQGYCVSFIGTPFKPGLDSLDNLPRRSIIVLNGNSALYKSVMKLSRNTFKIYVQHSNVNDGQSARWKTFVRKILLKLLLTRVDLVIRVCKNALPVLFAPNKVVTIYNGINLPQYKKKRTLTNIVNLLMVGAINGNKNQKLALDLLVRVPNTHLTIVGSGPGELDLKHYANAIGVTDRVVWAGFHRDPNPFYEQADFLLMLSKYEALPYVVLEAMAHGVPVISVPVGGVSEVINHKENSYLLKSYDIDELACHLRSIKECDYLKVSKNSRVTIEEGFTVDKMMERFLSEVDSRYKTKFGESFEKNCR